MAVRGVDKKVVASAMVTVSPCKALAMGVPVGAMVLLDVKLETAVAVVLVAARTVIVSEPVPIKPLPWSFTVLVRLSGPAGGFLSLKLATAVLMALSVPDSVMDLPETGTEPLALKRPFLSEIVTVSSVDAVANGSVTTMPLMLVEVAATIV